MKNIVFVFPGQGAQYVGMGKSLCEEYPEAKRTFEKASNVCNYDVLQFCSNCSYEDLINSSNSLSALLTTTVASFRVLEKRIRIKPKYLAGYSFGELSALVCANSISFEDALNISIYKGILIEGVNKKVEGAMTVINGIDFITIQEECRKISGNGKFVNIAVFNYDDSVVVSGDVRLVEELEQTLKKKSGKVRRLEIRTPFHSYYFKEACEKLEKELKKYYIKKPKVPVLSSHFVRLLNDKNDIIDSLSRHLVEAVSWRQTINYLKKDNRIIIEIGPKRILSSAMKDFETYSFGSPKDLPIIRDTFSLNKEDMLNIISKCLFEAISVKNFNEDEVNYEERVIKPYQAVKNILDKGRNSSKAPSVKNLIDSFLMLKAVLAEKMVNKEEAEKIIMSLYNDNPKLSYVKELDDIWNIKD